MKRVALFMALACFGHAAANAATVSLGALRNAMPSRAVVVEGRQLTGVLEADGLTDELRDRLLEFMESDSSSWAIDPVTRERVDALRRVRFVRDGRQLRHESIVLYVFTNDGNPRRQTVIWTDTERIEQEVQNSPLADRQAVKSATLAEFMDQIARGVRPWDLGRLMNGAYHECVDLATHLLSQAGDLRADTVDNANRLSSESAGISIYFDPNTLAVSEVWFPNPGRLGHTVHSFRGRLPDSTVGYYPAYWLVEQALGVERTRIQTVLFDSVRPAAQTELIDGFRWEPLAGLVRDKVTGVVYKRDGSVDQDATASSEKIMQSKPVEFFDMIDSDEGPIVVAHKPSGVSTRTAVVTLGIGLVLVGAIAAIRTRVG